MIQAFFSKHPLLGSYLYIASFSVIYQLLIYTSGMSGTVGLRQSLLMSMLWLLPFLLWPNRPQLVGAVLGLLLLPVSLLSLGYWMLYGQDFSQSVIFIIFESNSQEGIEFLESYLRWWQPLVLLAFCVVPWWLWRNLQPLNLSPVQRRAYLFSFVAIVTWPFWGTLLVKQEGLDAAAYHQLHRMEPAAPWTLVVGFYKYRQTLANMESLLTANAALPPLSDFKVNDAHAPETVVIVIGESTNRERMSLYGYGRQTTPKLDSIKDQLTVFADVVAPRPYTIEALQQVLSFADAEHPSEFMTRPNVLNMLKQAGYHTTWITNQQTQTRRNTMLTTLAQMADVQVYLNNNRDQNASQYDDVVLAPFAKALQSQYQRRAIIVHLLGTHRKYDYRYPETFAAFSGREGAPLWVPDNLLEEYNSYDNAILFNDYVVHALIQTLEQQKQRSLLVYFSDHGEEVYDSPEQLFTGRNESDPTPAMYTVPFITWTSPSWQEQHRWQGYSERRFQTSQFIHTLADMTGLSFDGLEPSRSVVSDNFVVQSRLIGDPDKPATLIDYDELLRPSEVAKSEQKVMDKVL